MNAETASRRTPRQPLDNNRHYSTVDSREMLNAAEAPLISFRPDDGGLDFGMLTSKTVLGSM